MVVVAAQVICITVEWVVRNKAVGKPALRMGVRQDSEHENECGEQPFDFFHTKSASFWFPRLLCEPTPFGGNRQDRIALTLDDPQIVVHRETRFAFRQTHSPPQGQKELRRSDRPMTAAKAVVNPPHSKRFAKFGNARQSRSVWSARGFSTTVEYVMFAADRSITHATAN